MPNANYKKATRLPVVVAFNAGNLLPVARALRERVPATRIVVLADDDHRTEGNPGVAKTDGPAPLHPGSSRLCHAAPLKGASTHHPKNIAPRRSARFTPSQATGSIDGQF
jgi:hypothetical protein